MDAPPDSRTESASQARREAEHFGVDLALLDTERARTPAERLEANEALVALAMRARRQTLTIEQRMRIERRDMLEEIRAYGFDEVIERYESMTPESP